MKIHLLTHAIPSCLQVDEDDLETDRIQTLIDESRQMVKSLENLSPISSPNLTPERKACVFIVGLNFLKLVGLDNLGHNKCERCLEVQLSLQTTINVDKSSQISVKQQSVIF